MGNRRSGRFCRLATVWLLLAGLFFAVQAGARPFPVARPRPATASSAPLVGDGNNLDVPGPLVATHVSISQINLSWVDNTANESTFEIQRKIGTQGFTFLASVGAGVTSYQNTGLTANTRYTYRVRAVTPQGLTAYSNEATANTSPVISFAAPVNYPLGSGPHSLSSADLDGDTHADLLVYAAGDVAVMYGRGDGTFSAPVNFNVGGSADPAWAYVVAADVDRDGRRDLVAAVGTDDTLVIRRNTDLRTFGSPVSYHTGDLPRGLTTHDFNQDGWIDVAVSCYASGDLAVHLNRGDGTFASPFFLPGSGGNPGTVTGGDYNRDGRWDLAMTHFTSNDVRLYFGAGTGDFTPGPAYPAGIAPESVWTADFNGDGAADLATPNSVGNDVCFLFNNGNGVFTRSPFYSTGAAPGQAQPGDFDRDGDQDLCLPASGANRMEVLVNGGNGSFPGPRQFPATGVGLRSTAVADFNEDTQPDVAVSQQGSLSVAVFINTTSEGPQAPPSAPANLAATATSSTEVSLSWTDTSTNEIGFKVERRFGATGIYSEVLQVGANSTTITDTALTPSTSYSYRVRAYNSIGSSGPSNPAGATTLAVILPAPTGIAATSIAADTIEVTWSFGNQAADAFEIERRSGFGAFSSVAVVGPQSRAYSDTSLAPNSEYAYQIRATSAAGDSAFSGAATALTRPGPPVELTVDAMSASVIRARWSDTMENETGFTLERKPGLPAAAGQYTTAGFIGPDETTFLDLGVQASTTYSYRIRVSNVAGISAPSRVVSVTTPQEPPPTPTGLQVSPLSGQRVQLTWSHSGLRITGFRVERRAQVGGYSQIATLPAADRAFVNLDVSPATTYTYRVFAFNGGGDSASSNEAGITTPPDPPGAPANLTVTPLSASSLRLTWVDPGNDEVGFKIERKTGPAAFALHTVIGPDQSSYVDVGLASERTYVYRLVAYNAGGDSPYSTEVAGTTHPEAPGAPQGLTALALSATTIQLDWLDISSNEAGFRVERRTDTGSFTEIGATGTDVSSYTDEGLQPNTTYRYRVRAHNVGGLSAYSNTANTATPAPPPVAPEGLQATVVSATEVALTWQDRSADETGFRVERSLGGASFLVLANLGPNVAAFRDVAAEPDSTYRYRVQSNRGSTRSDYSEVVTATTPVARGGQLVIGKKVDFKKIPVGTARTVSLVISNKDRNTALRVTIESPAAPFGLSSGTQTLVIPAKGKSTITLSFTPEARGAVFTTLVVHSSDPNRITNGVLLKGAGK